MTLLMLKIEEEQEKYRKLMRLAEELCIENFNFAGSDGENAKMEEIEGIFKRETSVLDGIDSEEVLQLKALCHVKEVFLKA